MTALPHPAVWWQWAIVALTVPYFPVIIALLAGVRRLPRSVRLGDAACVPVTVIVSARNEERDLPRCVTSLLALDYPADKLQVVLVDDRSDDATAAIVDDAASRHAHVLALHTAALSPNGLEAKARGIAHGFAKATGDWVFITDADAAVHPSWIRHMLGRATPRTGMTGGTVVVDADGAVGAIERISWGYTQLFSLGIAGWGLPFVCLGPNMAIRRSVYEAAGGLERADFRVAEDLALFTMAAHQKMEVQCYADAETAAQLRPVPSARHLISQQRRWLGGGTAQGWLYLLPLAAAFCWGFAIASYTIAGWLLGWRWWLAFVAAKSAIDAAGLLLQQRRLALAHHARYVWVLELYTAFIFFVLPPSFLFSRKIRWMGDGYAITYR
jgi:cellulose synthase/poly-beta-1,6-N-acetylglucosamine synthase-like glycosyltransferase